jgi:CubicO group peptidase (beta-lactamase class C family)
MAGEQSALAPVLAKAMAGTTVPGMGVAVIRGGKLAGLAVRGVRNIETKAPVQTSDRWFIASNTKPMTAVLILRLVEQGRLSLDAPLSKADPELAAAALPVYRGLTLRQMLAHTTGLPHDYHDVEKVMNAFGGGLSVTAERVAYLKLALSEPPLSPPGTKYHYSNTGFILAAAIAEHATGRSYEELMRQEIFAPLAMTSAILRLPGPDQNHGHMKGKLAAVKDEIPPPMNPAGGVSLRLGDWAKFCIDQLNGAKGHGKLLTPAGYRLMQSPLPKIGSGLDWGYDKRIGRWKGPILVHTGSDQAWESFALLFPDSGNALIVDANSGPVMGGLRADRAVLKALLPLVTEQMPAAPSKT